MSAIYKMKHLWIWMNNQFVRVQPLEVIVTEPPQTTVTFNEEKIFVHSSVPESGSESD